MVLILLFKFTNDGIQELFVLKYVLNLLHTTHIIVQK